MAPSRRQYGKERSLFIKRAPSDSVAIARAVTTVALFAARLPCVPDDRSVRDDCHAFSSTLRRRTSLNSARLATVDDAELRLDLTNAIQSLPEHYRQIVLLRDVDDLTIDEIAQSLSLSREAVKGRLHRARGLIREYLTG